jgi:hypothetical protein
MRYSSVVPANMRYVLLRKSNTRVQNSAFPGSGRVQRVCGLLQRTMLSSRDFLPATRHPTTAAEHGRMAGLPCCSEFVRICLLGRSMS